MLVVLYAINVRLILDELLTDSGNVSDVQVVEGDAVRSAAPVSDV